jgi:DNA-binding NarL/FixJ family response regulator
MLSHQKADSDFVSIVVADNTSIHTQLLADALRNDRGLQVVAAASNSEELLAAVTRVPIDVVVISHNLDDQPGYGVEVLRAMRALRPQIKGVILLDSSSPQEVLECFRAGARGIFSKHDRIESLSQCIRNVHEGQIWARSADLDHAFEALANSPLVRATNHKGIELLSERERQVIQHVAGGMSNREIAKALDLSPHTVKNYLFRIFDKLGVSSRTELLYLTMAHTSAVRPVNNEENPLAALIAAAEAGDPSAQLRMAEHFSQIKEAQSKSKDVEGKTKDKDIESGTPGPVADRQSASISAYMWYLLAEKTAPPLLEQIGTGKEAMRQTMSPQQLAEAESRAAAWIRHRREVETSGQRKMHVSAR